MKIKKGIIKIIWGGEALRPLPPSGDAPDSLLNYLSIHFSGIILHRLCNIITDVFRLE